MVTMILLCFYANFCLNMLGKKSIFIKAFEKVIVLHRETLLGDAAQLDHFSQRFGYDGGLRLLWL